MIIMNKPNLILAAFAIGVVVLLSACDSDDTQDNTTKTEFSLTSSAIENGELLDAYKCEEKVNDMENSIPLSWSNVPEAANSLAIVMKHYPYADDLTKVNSYLLLWGIDPSVTKITYGTADDGPWYMGANKDGTAISYTSPCSPSAGTHEYIVTLYALSEMPSALPKTSSLEVDYAALTVALESVEVINMVSLTFNDIN